MDSHALASSSAESSTARTTDQASSSYRLTDADLLWLSHWLMESDDTESTTDRLTDADLLWLMESDDSESSTYRLTEADRLLLMESDDSESSTARVWKYDVFLSFRGPDTRKGITFELYDRLQNRGIKTFKDDPDLEVGDVISPTLLKAIGESRFAIVVLSPNYAYSTWCLEELAKICECMEDNKILPLFYNVDPKDVRHQLNSFGEAFAKHGRSGRYESEKVQQWKNALNRVAGFSGWHSEKATTDRQLVEDIVEFVYSKVQPMEINVGDFQEFEAPRQAMNEVIKSLKDDKVTAVGVYGMGGVGNTSMVKHVGEYSRKIGIFHHVIMGVVSQSPDLKKIQGTLAELLLGKKLKEDTEIGRAARLKKEIMRREKILIILDDVWSRIELSDIGIPSLKELQNCNSKLLLTTRRENICHSMGCKAKIPLDVLSKEDSWTLFMRNAGRSSFDSTNFEDLARKVAAECKGLPIALIAISKALGDKGLVEWERAARRLEKSQRAHPDDEDCAFQCIKLSYDYLRDNDCKSCFLLCCLFPEDYDIPIQNLFDYGFGIGLFRGHDDTIHEARETADTAVAHLKNCSLLLDGEGILGSIDERYVRMHDVIRDTAVNIADEFLVKAGCGLTDWPCQSHGGYAAISLMHNDICELSKEVVCPKLQILLLRNNYYLNEISEAFFQCSNELRVLDLSFTSVSILPYSFTLLTSLQALYLDWCDTIIDISILGKLKKLEILRMRKHPLTELSREIGNLTNLRLLDVGGEGDMFNVERWEKIVTIPSKVISKLHRLEEVYILGCGFDQTSNGIEELAGLPNLKVLQVCIADAKCIPENVEVELNLVYFDIHICTRKIDTYLEGPLNSRSLYLEDTTIRTLPDWFVKAVATKTEKLEYTKCRGLTDILMEYDHGRLHELKSLSIDGQESALPLTVLMDTTTRLQKGPVFQNLEELRLEYLCLEEFCVGEIPAGSLINLKVFHAAACFRLENLSKLLYRLPNLEEIHLHWIHKIEYVIEYEGFEPEQSKLREMHLSNLDSLKSICKGPGPRAMFQSLKCLTIKECERLRSLFTSDVAQFLFQLEDLRVKECPLLERVIEASNETMNSEKTVLPELKKLAMTRLPKLYSGGASVDIELPSLEHLYVKDCPQVSFPTSASDFFHSRNRVQLADKEWQAEWKGEIFHDL